MRINHVIIYSNGLDYDIKIYRWIRVFRVLITLNKRAWLDTGRMSGYVNTRKVIKAVHVDIAKRRR